MNRRPLFAAAAGLTGQAWLPERKAYSFVGGWAATPTRLGHIPSVTFAVRDHILAAWFEHNRIDLTMIALDTNPVVSRFIADGHAIRSECEGRGLVIDSGGVKFMEGVA